MAFTVGNSWGIIERLVDSSLVDQNGDISASLELPNDGIVRLILGVMVEASGITTMMANPELTGPDVAITRSTATLMIFPSTRWLKVSTDRLRASFLVDSQIPVLPTDEVALRCLETDTNATPTVDYAVVLLTQRLRST